MKKSIVKMACALVLALGMTSCGSVGLVGAVYTGYTEPAAVTSNELGTKVGQASAVSVLGVAAAGDAGPVENELDLFLIGYIHDDLSVRQGS